MLNYIILEELVAKVPRCDNKKKVIPFSEQTKKEIHKKCKSVCQLCRSENKGELQCHHIHPRGPPTVDNGIILCELCHMVVHLYLKLLRGYIGVPNRGLPYRNIDDAMVTHLLMVSAAMNEINKEMQQNNKQAQQNKKDIESLASILYQKINVFEERADSYYKLIEEYDKQFSKLPKYIIKKYSITWRKRYRIVKKE